jgi:hypothetical protein
MRPHETRHWSLILIVPLLVGALGCQPGSAPEPEAAPAVLLDEAPRSVTFEEEIEFGPGSLDLPDLRVGLGEASSYGSTLTVSFEGTLEGQPLNWSGTYTFAAARDPLARQLTIETYGDESQLPVLMLEVNGVAYEKSGEGLCLADLIDPANSAVAELEPAAQLPSLFGAEEAGTETLDGVQAAHYTFDERALTEAGLNKSAGEVWVASEGGYVLRYHHTTTGDASYFGEGTEGTLTYDYELTDFNEAAAIALPEGCPPGLVDAPLLSDASSIESLPGLLTYETAAGVQDVMAFYELELPKLGWAAPKGGDLADYIEGSPEEIQQALEYLRAIGPAVPPTPTPNPNEANALFEQGDEILIVTLSRVGPVTQVMITLGNTET